MLPLSLGMPANAIGNHLGTIFLKILMWRSLIFAIVFCRLNLARIFRIVILQVHLGLQIPFKSQDCMQDWNQHDKEGRPDPCFPCLCFLRCFCCSVWVLNYVVSKIGLQCCAFQSCFETNVKEGSPSTECRAFLTEFDQPCRKAYEIVRCQGVFPVCLICRFKL